jgi:hypothetical protein
MITWHVGTENSQGPSEGSATGDDEPYGVQHAVLDDHPDLTACGLPLGLFQEFKAMPFEVRGLERCRRCLSVLSAREGHA